MSFMSPIKAWLRLFWDESKEFLNEDLKEGLTRIKTGLVSIDLAIFLILIISGLCFSYTGYYFESKLIFSIAELLCLCFIVYYILKAIYFFGKDNGKREIVDLIREYEPMLLKCDACQIDNSCTVQGNEIFPVRSDTFSRLLRAVDSFPAKYPKYSSIPPKLDNDVRPWLKNAGIAISDREAHVFGAIIADHFKL